MKTETMTNQNGLYSPEQQQKLYVKEGWLNFDYIKQKPAWLITIIGKRQVGKTYGTLQLMLKDNLKHILLRRTTAELDTICASSDLNPYQVFEPEFKVDLFKSGKRLCQICDYAEDEQGKRQPIEQRGIATSLAEIAHVRGFNGSLFTDLVFDEFIPEKGVIVKRSEGDSFLNAYTTINGNRELEGKPPLRAWLLANTNNINSPVLEALNLTDDILYMRRKGKEELLTDNGVYIIQPKSEIVTARRKETALMRQVSKNSEFYGMAIENEFAYDQSPYIKTIPIKHLTPVFNYADIMYCWQTSEGFYMCRSKGKVPASCRYDSSRTDREKLSMDFSQLKPYYYAGLIYFADMRLLSLFKSIFGID